LVSDAFLDTTKVAAGTSQWMENWLIYGLGRAKELGYPSDALLSWVAVHLIGQLTDAQYSPYYTGAYRTPTVDAVTGRWYNSWSGVATGFLPLFTNNHVDFLTPQQYFVSELQNNEQGYSVTTFPAAAMAAGEPGGPAAWSWIAQNARALDTSINTDPKWAILPR
jgi:hypothetical protein